MATFTHDEARWAAQTAAQLRLLQADCSDTDAGEREQYLHDEISRALKDVVRERHPQHLEALAAQFPTGEGQGAAQPAALTGSTAPVELTPEELLAQMVKIAPLLPRRKLQDFGLQLQQAGYLELQTTALADAPPEELLKRFPIDPLARVDLQRRFFSQPRSTGLEPLEGHVPPHPGPAGRHLQWRPAPGRGALSGR
jgi:hypothetical protein